MANPFKNNHFWKWFSVACGIISLAIGGVCLYRKEYVIGAALLFNVFICYTNYMGWKKKGR